MPTAGTVHATSAHSPAPRAIGISFNSLLNGDLLPDGDIVKAEVTPETVDRSLITITLKLDGVTWWKGIQAGSIVLCQAQAPQNVSSATFPCSSLQTYGLQLWKAKTFGIHTEMYNITDAATRMSGGNTYVFTWKRD